MLDLMEWHVITDRLSMLGWDGIHATGWLKSMERAGDISQNHGLSEVPLPTLKAVWGQDGLGLRWLPVLHLWALRLLVPLTRW